MRKRVNCLGKTITQLNILKGSRFWKHLAKKEGSDCCERTARRQFHQVVQSNYKQCFTLVFDPKAKQLKTNWHLRLGLLGNIDCSFVILVLLDFRKVFMKLSTETTPLAICAVYNLVCFVCLKHMCEHCANKYAVERKNIPVTTVFITIDVDPSLALINASSERFSVELGVSCDCDAICDCMILYCWLGCWYCCW